MKDTSVVGVRFSLPLSFCYVRFPLPSPTRYLPTLKLCLYQHTQTLTTFQAGWCLLACFTPTPHMSQVCSLCRRAKTIPICCFTSVFFRCECQGFRKKSYKKYLQTICFKYLIIVIYNSIENSFKPIY